jgi:hypothetical protein
VKDSAGRTIERGKNQEPKCGSCKKYDPVRERGWDGFTPLNYYYFSTYRGMAAFHCLPARGGLDNQLPKTMEIMLLLDSMFKASANLQEQRFQQKVASSFKGLR